MHLTEWRSLRGAAIEQVGVRPAISSLPASLPPITLLPHPLSGVPLPFNFRSISRRALSRVPLRSNLAFGHALLFSVTTFNVLPSNGADVAARRHSAYYKKRLC